MKLIHKIHASGRYNYNALIKILKHDHPELVDLFGIDLPQYMHNSVVVNRLDRLTSGVFILPRVVDVARQICNDIFEGKVNKEYVARVQGYFPG